MLACVCAGTTAHRFDGGVGGIFFMSVSVLDMILHMYVQELLPSVTTTSLAKGKVESSWITSLAVDQNPN